MTLTRHEKLLAAADHLDPSRQVGGSGIDPRARFWALVGTAGGGSSGDNTPEVLVVGGARWLYPWVKVTVGNGPLYQPVPVTSISSITMGRALNMAELNHIAPALPTADWIVGEIQANPAAPGSTYPAGFSVRPIGERRPQLVEMRFENVTNGSNRLLIPVFYCRNNHDGTCST